MMEFLSYISEGTLLLIELNLIQVTGLGKLMKELMKLVFLKS